MDNSQLIFTLSGIRGIYGKALTDKAAKKIAIAFGLWLKEKKVILCRDTRPSGENLEQALQREIYFLMAKKQTIYPR